MQPVDANVSTYERFRGQVVGFHRWHGKATVLQQVLLVAGWACVMGLFAQLALPTRPVPFTLQVFGVVLGAVLLGARNGALAQVAYVGAGAAGVPWFQGAVGGWGVSTGETMGYLIGFPLAAIVIGLGVNAFRVRGYWGLVGLMALGTALIFLLGWAWLALLVGGLEAFLLGVLIFLPFDALKVFLAAGLAVPFLPPRPARAS